MSGGFNLGTMDPDSYHRHRDQEFMMFVREHSDLYEGRILSEPEVCDIESQLGMRFPSILKWLWANHGASMRSGFDNVSQSVRRTLELRRANRFPEGYLLLNDWNDVGVVVGQQVNLDHAPDLRVVWMDSCDLKEFLTTEIPPQGADVFPTYIDWLYKRFEMEED